MLASKETINVVADAMEKYKVTLSVIDPVFLPSFTLSIFSFCPLLNLKR